MIKIVCFRFFDDFLDGFPNSSGKLKLRDKIKEKSERKNIWIQKSAEHISNNPISVLRLLNRFEQIYPRLRNLTRNKEKWGTEMPKDSKKESHMFNKTSIAVTKMIL